MCTRLWCFEDADLSVDEAVDVRNLVGIPRQDASEERMPR